MHVADTDPVRGPRAVSFLKEWHFTERETDEEEPLYDANSRVGFDRVCIGTGGGSAAQEGWHGSVLQNRIPQKYLSPENCLANLDLFGKSRCWKS